MKSLTEQWKDELEFAKNMVKEAEHAYGSNPGSVAGRAELGEARQRLGDVRRYSNDLEFNDRLQESNARARPRPRPPLRPRPNGRQTCPSRHTSRETSGRSGTRHRAGLPKPRRPR